MHDIQHLHTALLASLDTDAFARTLPIATPAHKHDVRDHTSHSYVCDASRSRIGVLTCSNRVNPDMIARSVTAARMAKQALAGPLGQVVLEPLAAGVYDGLSYAIWPLRRRFSALHVVRYLQERVIVPKVVRWLTEVHQHTMSSPLQPPVLESHCRQPLLHVSKDDRLPAEIRAAAARAIERLESGAWRPVCVLCHGDLWLGNILLPLARRFPWPDPYGFAVIDWAAASLTGHPFSDLLQFCRSDRLSSHDRHLCRARDAICRIVECDRQDTLSYALSALGWLGTHLEHFPEQRYLEMSRDMFSYASALA